MRLSQVITLCIIALLSWWIWDLYRWVMATERGLGAVPVFCLIAVLGIVVAALSLLTLKDLVMGAIRSRRAPGDDAPVDTAADDPFTPR